MEIGEKIKERRCEIGLSQTELGKRMGVTRSTVCKVEKGAEANLTIDRIRAFADALGCSVGYLIGEKPTASEDKQADIVEFNKPNLRMAFAKSRIVAIAEVNVGGEKRSQIWCAGDEKAFVVNEPYDEVIRKIKGGE